MTMTSGEMTDWIGNALLASGPVHQTLKCFYVLGRPEGGMPEALVLETNDGEQYVLQISGPLSKGERVALEGPDASGLVLQETYETEPEEIGGEGVDSTPVP